MVHQRDRMLLLKHSISLMDHTFSFSKRVEKEVIWKHAGVVEAFQYRTYVLRDPLDIIIYECALYTEERGRMDLSCYM